MKLSEARALAWPVRQSLVWFTVVGLLGLAATGTVLIRGGRGLSHYFLMSQDLGLLISGSLCLVLILLPSVRLSAALQARVEAFAARRGLMCCLVLALLVGALAYYGWSLVYQNYPLSMDEFWASFDARIFQHGRLLAEVPDEWRPFVPAMQPMWRMETAGDQFWASTYLPVSAGFRALFGVLGSQALTGPAWAALSIILTYALARGYWPERRDAAVVCVVLLATSSQFLVMAMSPYAMAAHLALNLAWLWLFQRRGLANQAGAIAVAFAATGLHQVIFHPLFAAPFVLQLWIGRRWRAAVLHTLAYGLICLFWISYWRLMLDAQGVRPASNGALSAASFMQLAMNLVLSFKLSGVVLMAENLLRFVAWQNPLAVTLGLAGAVTAVVRPDRLMWPLATGIVLTVSAMFVLLPYQGHGWGYRYLHGYLGSLCLLGGFAWVRWVEPGGAAGRRAWAAAVVSVVFCLALAIPTHARQAYRFIQPYARSYAAIQASSTDIVMVDPDGLMFGVDLVRNDPWLLEGPKVMDIDALTEAQVRTVCGRHSVAVFDRATGEGFGVRVTPSDPGRPAAGLRVLMRAIRCGVPLSAPNAPGPLFR